jgi:hypothetical protein
MRKMMALHVVAVALIMAWTGCTQPPVGPDDLASLTEDANNNGFPEVPPPEGVSFEEFGSVNVRFASTVTTDDLAGLATEMGVDPNLLNLATITVTAFLTLDYGDGIVDELEQAENLEPFELLFEVACPLTVHVEGVVDVSAPIVGSQEAFREGFDLTQGVDYECGQTLDIEASMTDLGTPQVTLNVE